MMNKDAKIYVAGHRGLVGSSIVRCLQEAAYRRIVSRTRHELDLRDNRAVDNFFAQEQPEYVFLAAAKVGGIQANNTHPATFIADNLMMQTNVIHSSSQHGVKKLLFLGSSCIYPRDCPQPMKEEYLLSGYLEPTNQSYAIAKIAGIEMCQAYNRQYGTNFISVMPTNLYGPGDNFDLNTSHVLAALIRKCHDAKIRSSSGHERESVVVWGTGEPRREFLHVDDLADACVFLMNSYDDPEIVNIGTGDDLSIKELVTLIKEVVGFDGDLAWDTTKPDGTPRKLLDVSRLNALGWRYQIPLRKGIEETYKWFCDMIQPNAGEPAGAIRGMLH